MQQLVRSTGSNGLPLPSSETLRTELCKGRNLRISDLGGRRSTGGWVFRSLNGRFRISEAQAEHPQRKSAIRPFC